jgi:hypothetical protein
VLQIGRGERSAAAANNPGADEMVGCDWRGPARDGGRPSHL